MALFKARALLFNLGPAIGRPRRATLNLTRRRHFPLEIDAHIYCAMTPLVDGQLSCRSSPACEDRVATAGAQEIQTQVTDWEW